MKDITINYETIGSGKAIVLIHGYTVDHRLMTGCMEPVFQGRDDKYKRIYIDLPGMGKTKGEKWIKNSDIMLDVVIDFINTVIPNESFLLAGESYGGYLARGIINRIPDRVDGLFLLCPGIIADFTKRNLPQHTVIKKDDELLSQIQSSDAEDFASFQVVQNERTWDRYRNEIIPGVKAADITFLNDLRENGYGFSFDVDKMNQKFNKPALILLGRQGRIQGCVEYS